MSAVDGFAVQQRRVAANMAVAVLVTAAVLAGAFLIGAGEPDRPVAERLALTLKADLVVMLWLAAAVANVARLRFFSPEDIAGGASGAPSPRVRQAGAILQNTLEQAALAVPVHLGLAATCRHSVSLTIALVILFTLGRALFWAGSAKGAAGRALGFALTFYPTVAALVIALFRLSPR